MYKYVFLFLALFFYNTSDAQEYNFPKKTLEDFVFFKTSDNKIHVLDKKNDFVFYKGKWKENKLTLGGSTRDSLILNHPKGFNNLNFKAIEIRNKQYFVLDGGGPILQLQNDSLFRIDNSVDQRNQFGAATFVYKNKLYKYGGYGFWSFKDYISYFDFSSYQWELFKTQSENQPRPRWKAIFALNKNQLYVLGGRSNLPENFMTDVILKDLFVVDLDAKTINTLTPQVNPKTPKGFHTHNNGFDFDNNRAYLHNNQITVFDFLNNKFNNYDTNELFVDKSDNVPILNISDTLVFVKKIKGVNKLSFVPLNKIKKGFKESVQLILDPVEKTYVNQVFLALACIMFIVFVYKLFAYKDYINKLVQHDQNWLYYSGKKTKITKEQSSVINLLEKKGQFTSVELNSIISKDKKYAKSHLTLLRKKLIDALNESYFITTGFDKTLIKSSKLPTDKRQILYKTSKEIFKKDSFLRFLFKT